MTKLEFIEWLEEKSGFSRDFTNDVYWKELIDYADYVFDELELEENKVIFKWEEKGWGYTDYHTEEYSFEDFIYKYENAGLKYGN